MTTPETIQTIGFIGTGIMGSRMAANLMSAGYQLNVHNRTPEKAQSLVQQGAQWAETPAAAAQNADVIITMLAHPVAVEAAALDDKTGFLQHLKPSTIWIDCSTVNPAFSRRMAAETQRCDGHFLDAPVAGSKNQAQDGHLVFFVGGDEATINTCQPLFDAMGKQVNHVGEQGMGISLKLVINHLLASSMMAFAEGLALGEALGLSQEMLLNSLIGSVVVPPYMAGKRGKIANGDYEAEFPLQWMQKDMQMVAETAFTLGTAMPVANTTKEIYQLAAQYGYAEADFSAIYAFIKGANDKG